MLRLRSDLPTGVEAAMFMGRRPRREKRNLWRECSAKMLPPGDRGGRQPKRLFGCRTRPHVSFATERSSAVADCLRTGTTERRGLTPDGGTNSRSYYKSGNLTKGLVDELANNLFGRR